MVQTPSVMVELGLSAPEFSLPGTDNRIHTLREFDGNKALLVMFICNHCPFVKHVAAELAAIGREYQPKGVGIVAINSNNVATHPDDSPAKMVEAAKAWGFTFPYLFDESQSVARAYRAACTPDFFLYDAKRILVYRGQLDASRPGNGIPVTGKDLRVALEAVIEGKAVPAEQKPSIGCNIKWKPGNEPAY